MSLPAPDEPYQPLTTAQDVDWWLQCYCEIEGSYRINADLSVCVTGSVRFTELMVQHKITRLPIQFKTVSDNFHSRAITFGLDGPSSQRILEPDLTTLSGMPEFVGGDFSVSGNHALESLEGGPLQVGGSFFCVGCSQLKDLRGAPQKLGGDFHCSYCPQLVELTGLPQPLQVLRCTACPQLKTTKGLGTVGTLNCQGSPLFKNWNTETFELPKKIITNRLPQPSPALFRRLLHNRVELPRIADQRHAPWLCALQTYYENQDLLPVLSLFEKLYREPLYVAPPADPVASSISL